MKKLFVILGSTSTGKTRLALTLAKKFNGVLVSADSRQVYKYMDIGTGKIPFGSDMKIEKADQKWGLNGINVWGYDLVNPNEYFSAFDYAVFATNKINNLKDSDFYDNIFLVGGTGFYIDIVTGRVQLDRAKPDFELRKELNQLSNTQLVDRLMSLNPDKLNKIDRANKIRLMRAIEKELSKKSDNLDSSSIKLSNLEPVYIGLTSPREQLYKKVDNWLETIWENGLINEVKWLINNGYGLSPKLNGIIYNTAMQYIDGELGESEAKQRTKFDLHAYIRKQQTYFKRNDKISWFDIEHKNTNKNVEYLLQ